MDVNRIFNGFCTMWKQSTVTKSYVVNVGKVIIKMFVVFYQEFDYLRMSDTKVMV